MTDEQLMEAVKNGDLQQASLLFERYHKRIFHFLAHLTLDRMQAEDLTQNVFLRIIRYRQSYRDGARFQSWIYQVARNVFADHYQATRQRPVAALEVAYVSDTLPDHSLAIDQEDREQRLHQSLARLNEEQRELLVLTRFQHMKYEEVATLMNTSVANIKVKVHRAIARLREVYFELEKQS